MPSKYKKDKNGYYQTKVTIGYDSETGKRIRKPIYSRTIAGLEDKKRELKDEFSQNPIGLTPYTTFHDYSKQWLDIFKAQREHNTREMYLNALKHIDKEFGHLPMKSVTQMHIQALINKHFSKPSTCEKIMLTLNQIFKNAIINGIIKINPVQMITLPEKKVCEKRALYDFELSAITKCNFTIKEKAVVSILYYFGLRPEELYALKKNDFDFIGHTLTITRATIYNSKTKTMEVKATKTQNGARTMHIPASCETFIQQYVNQCPTEYLFTRDIPPNMLNNSNALMLYDQPLSKWCARTLWKNIVTKIQTAYGLDYQTTLSANEYQLLANKAKDQGKTLFVNVYKLTHYTFRHNYATMLYYSGISLKKAAKLMGHSDINMIMKIYAHLDEERENTSEKLDTNISLKI